MNLSRNMEIPKRITENEKKKTNMNKHLHKWSQLAAHTRSEKRRRAHRNTHKKNPMVKEKFVIESPLFLTEIPKFLQQKHGFFVFGFSLPNGTIARRIRKIHQLHVARMALQNPHKKLLYISLKLACMCVRMRINSKI